MRHMAITFSVDDLRNALMMERCEALADCVVAWQRSLRRRGIPTIEITHTHLARLFGFAAGRVLRCEWIRKLFLIRNDLPWLEDLRVTFTCIRGPDFFSKDYSLKAMVIPGTDFKETIRTKILSTSQPGSEDAGTLSDALNHAEFVAHKIIRDEVLSNISTKWRNNEIGSESGSSVDRPIGGNWLRAQMRGECPGLSEAEARAEYLHLIDARVV